MKHLLRRRLFATWGNLKHFSYHYRDCAVGPQFIIRRCIWKRAEHMVEMIRVKLQRQLSATLYLGKFPFVTYISTLFTETIFSFTSANVSFELNEVSHTL
jgi:hypothetical protein